jgi:hypothetical protein
MRLECGACTFKNNELQEICEMCGTGLPRNENKHQSLFIPSKAIPLKSQKLHKEKLSFRGPLSLNPLKLEEAKFNSKQSAIRKSKAMVESSRNKSPSTTKSILGTKNSRSPLAAIPINCISIPLNSQDDEVSDEAKLPAEVNKISCSEHDPPQKCNEEDKIKKLWVKKKDGVSSKAEIPIEGGKLSSSENQTRLHYCSKEAEMKKLWVQKSDKHNRIYEASSALRWPWEGNRDTSSMHQNRWYSSLWNHQIFPHWNPPSLFGVERKPYYSRKEMRSINPPRQERLNINRNRRKSETFHSVGSDHTLERIKEIERRRKLTHVILLDLDNWHSFFEGMERLRDEHKKSFPNGTFLCGYTNGYEFQEPAENEPGFKLLNDLRQDPDGGVVIEICLCRKDAADFAICVRFGQLDQAVGVQIPITILSGDGGFNELTRCNKRREVYIVNPVLRDFSEEDKAQQDLILYTRLISIGDQHHIPEAILQLSNKEGEL